MKDKAQALIETLELSKRLSECADWHDFMSKLSLTDDYKEAHAQWAEDLRAIVIPSPIGERETMYYIQCKGCKRTATITSDGVVKPIKLQCSCGVETPYEPGDKNED